MGCPDRYYHMALRQFAYNLAYMQSDIKLADAMYEETSIQKLEDYIETTKPKIPQMNFYYEAGRATQIVLQKSGQEGCDALNASYAGLLEFEDFIGLPERED